MLVRAIVRRWGSSLAAVIPPEVLRSEGIAAGDEVTLEVHKAKTLRDTFGHLRGTPLNAQKVKDQIRREESE